LLIEERFFEKSADATDIPDGGNVLIWIYPPMLIFIIVMRLV
jgi:hypothetical protein